MNPCFYLVTFRRDLLMAVWAVRSLILNMRGDWDLTVGVPDSDLALATALFGREREILGGRMRIFSFEEPAGKGFNTHQKIECRADLEAPGFSHYIHVDSDCLLRKPLDVSIFFENGRGIWYYDYYAEIMSQNANLKCWQHAVKLATGLNPRKEYMRCFPIVIPHDTYAATRGMVERHTKQDFGEYVINCENAYPQTFAEYNTLGFCANVKNHPIAWKRFVRETPAWGKGTFAQFWTHGGPDFVMPDGPSAGLSARGVAKELGIE